MQQVKFGNCLGSLEQVLSGVPQGSVLGPLLFLIYINSIFNIKLFGKITGFADDLTLTYEVDSFDELELQMNSDLKRLRQWFLAHKMLLSDKSKGMIFNMASKSIRELNIVYHGLKCNNLGMDKCTDCLKLDFVHEYKYLGIIIDDKLSFKSHILSVKSYSYFAIRKLYLLRFICPFDVILKVYYAIFNSKLECGLVINGGAYISNIKFLIIAQKFADRILHNKHRTFHSFPLFCKSKILPIRSLYIYKVLKIFFQRSGHKIIKNSSYSLRNSKNCITPFTRKEYFKRFFLSTAPHLFNQVPKSIQSELSLLNFTKKVKEWLLSLENVEFLFHVIK